MKLGRLPLTTTRLWRPPSTTKLALWDSRANWFLRGRRHVARPACPDGETSSAIPLHARDLDIALPSSDRLPHSKAGVDCAATLGGSDGSGAYKWIIANGPSWLKVDRKTGVLGGKPPAEGENKTTAAVTDPKSGACPGCSFPKIFSLSSDTFFFANAE